MHETMTQRSKIETRELVAVDQMKKSERKSTLLVVIPLVRKAAVFTSM